MPKKEPAHKKGAPKPDSKGNPNDAGRKTSNVAQTDRSHVLGAAQQSEDGVPSALETGTPQRAVSPTTAREPQTRMQPDISAKPQSFTTKPGSNIVSAEQALGAHSASDLQTRPSLMTDATASQNQIAQVLALMESICASRLLDELQASHPSSLIRKCSNDFLYELERCVGKRPVHHSPEEPAALEEPEANIALSLGKKFRKEYKELQKHIFKLDENAIDLTHTADNLIASPHSDEARKELKRSATAFGETHKDLVLQDKTVEELTAVIPSVLDQEMKLKLDAAPLFEGGHTTSDDGLPEHLSEAEDEPDSEVRQKRLKMTDRWAALQTSNRRIGVNRRAEVPSTLGEEGVWGGQPVDSASTPPLGPSPGRANIDPQRSTERPPQIAQNVSTIADHGGTWPRRASSREGGRKRNLTDAFADAASRRPK